MEWRGGEGREERREGKGRRVSGVGWPNYSIERRKREVVGVDGHNIKGQRS